MRAKLGPTLWGMATLACLWLISCTSPATPTAEPQGVAETARPSASLPATVTIATPSAILGRSPTTTPAAPPTPTVLPMDTAAPVVTLGGMPTVVGAADGLKVTATARDDRGVVRMALVVDGQIVHEVAESSLRQNLDTRALAVGAHTLAVQAWDAAGNRGVARATFAITGTPTPALTAAPTAALSPTAPPAPTVSVEPTKSAEPSATPAPLPVTVAWGEISIPTYGYRQALYTDSAAGHPYPLLHWEQVTGPAPVTYRALVLRNAYVQLTLLPELGGRIYQCRYLPTGQDLLYNNVAIKPTHWGPSDQGWWLAAGGIEFCLPVDEHGYVTAEPWQAEVQSRADGSATVVLSITERSRNLVARVELTLRADEAGFRLRMSAENPDSSDKSMQYWVNAMLSPGTHGVQPSLRFYYPTTHVTVHSRGDAALPDAGGTMSWPVADGRDMSRYASWRNWLGMFAPQLDAAYTAVYDPTARVGLVRTFAPGAVRGNKLFGFGQGFDPAVYTDDGAQYVEMWGGLTPTFWDYATVAGNGRVAWDEYWWVLAGVEDLSTANAQAALLAVRDGDHLNVTVTSPGRHDWTLVVSGGGQELARRDLAVAPDSPWRVSLDGMGNSSATLTVRILDEMGNEVLACAV